MLRFRSTKLDSDKVLDYLNIQKTNNVHLRSVLRSNENANIKYKNDLDHMHHQIG